MSERVLEPLEMSDTEILDWLGENMESLHYWTASQAIRAGYQLHWSGMDAVFSGSVRDVVCKAAAYHKEASQ